MTSIDEETINAVPGIDDDSDDAEPWAANLSFPDLMEKDGWQGPICMALLELAAPSSLTTLACGSSSLPEGTYRPPSGSCLGATMAM